MAKIKGNHIVVNHELRFTNEEGHQHNLIGGEWFLFKSDLKQEREFQNLKLLATFRYTNGEEITFMAMIEMTQPKPFKNCLDYCLKKVCFVL